MIAKIYIEPPFGGYVAGTGAGIASIDGQGTIALVIAFEALTLQVVQSTWSLGNGHYLLRGLDPNGRYMIVGRDPSQNYEPAAYDNVRPANDLSLTEQEALWQQMLSS